MRFVGNFGTYSRTKIISSNTTLVGKEDIFFMNCSSGDITVILPTAVGKLGKILEFIKNETSSNNMIMTPNGAETINGMSSITLNQAYSSLKLKSNGTNWNAEWYPIMKQYDLTVTRTDWTTTYAKGIPYQTINGFWRLNFNVGGSMPSASRTGLSVTVSGITAAAYSMSLAIMAACSANTSLLNMYVNSSSAVLTFTHNTATTTTYRYSGELELSGKPTFAE